MIMVAAFDDLDTRTLYGLLRLRAAVFVVEQACPYLDPDGRDIEPGCRHLWVEEDGEVIAALRLVADDDGVHRIGRVATAVPARGRGLAAQLVERAVELARGAVRLDAQSHLAGWYSTLGFEVAGEEFVDDGIPHVPMNWGHP